MQADKSRLTPPNMPQHALFFRVVLESRSSAIPGLQDTVFPVAGDPDGVLLV